MTRQEFIDHAATVLFVQLVGDDRSTSRSDDLIAKRAYALAVALWEARQAQLSPEVGVAPQFDAWKKQPTRERYDLELAAGFFLTVFQSDDKKWSVDINHHDLYVDTWYLSDEAENPGPFATREEAQARGLKLFYDKLHDLVPLLAAIETRVT